MKGSPQDGRLCAAEPPESPWGMPPQPFSRHAPTPAPWALAPLLARGLGGHCPPTTCHYSGPAFLSLLLDSILGQNRQPALVSTWPPWQTQNSDPQGSRRLPADPAVARVRGSPPRSRTQVWFSLPTSPVPSSQAWTSRLPARAGPPEVLSSASGFRSGHSRRAGEGERSQLPEWVAGDTAPPASRSPVAGTVRSKGLNSKMTLPCCKVNPWGGAQSEHATVCVCGLKIWFPHRRDLTLEPPSCAYPF